jgi:LemA protein
MKILSHLQKRYRAQQGLGTPAIILLALLAVIILAGLSLAGSYNSLVTLDTQVQQYASNVDVQLKRRADLIPNLVNTVKGYAKHEKDIYIGIAEARSRLLSSDFRKNPQEATAANNALNNSLGRLLAIAERYPDLKADRNFIGLQDSLEGTENRISEARRQYNETVTSYNSKVRSFPTVMIAPMMGFAPKPVFEATQGERAVPTVNF